MKIRFYLSARRGIFFILILAPSLLPYLSSVIFNSVIVSWGAILESNHRSQSVFV